MKRRKRYEWLADTINKHQFRIGVEVGAATGNTTEFLLKHCSTLERLIIVDLWSPIPISTQWNREDMESIFRKRFHGEPRLTILKGVSWEQAEQLINSSLDFAFIDASHDYESVLKDILAFTPKVRKGGIVCGHDINLIGVEKATKLVFKNRVVRTGIDNTWYVLV